MTTPPLKEYGETSFVTGLRAYAVFAVILIHSGGAGLRELGDIGNNIVDWGRTGVYIFFVISGFAITASYFKEKTTGDFYLKRLVRIIPLYYCILIYAYFTGKNDEFSLMLHLFFINWLDPLYATDMISVEWSIPIELFFYALFPLFLKNGTLKKIFLCTIFAFIFYFVMHAFIQWGVSREILNHNIWLQYHFSPLNYFFPFLMGALAYFVRRDFLKKIHNHRHSLFGFAGIIILYLWVFTSSHEMIFMTFATFLMIVAGGTNNKISSIMMDNRPAQFLGKISYSLYLTHIFAIYWANSLNQSPLITFILASALAIIVSTATYIIIERPPQLWLSKVLKK